MALPLQLPWPQAQTRWKSQIDPVLVNPLVSGQLLTDIVLISGVTVINHMLGQKLTGWFIIGIDAVATIYDTQASNQTPQTTLVLVSNAVCTVNLWVF